MYISGGGSKYRPGGSNIKLIGSGSGLVRAMTRPARPVPAGLYIYPNTSEKQEIF